MFPTVLMAWVSRVSQAGHRALQHALYKDVRLKRANLSTLARNQAHLPLMVRESAVAMRYLTLLGPLDWEHFPERDLDRNWGIPAVPYAPFVAACLVKVDQQFRYMSRLRRYLVEHPALVWILGFPLTVSRTSVWGFDVEASLPAHRHFNRMLRTMPNQPLQFLLTSTVHVLIKMLPTTVRFGEVISLDTKHILAWVQENNPKAYVAADIRYDKTQQPAGDPDCRLGCKKRHNHHSQPQDSPSTPRANPVPASTVKVGEFYWGYGTGVVATKLPDWGEFVLAEYTQPFNCADISYYFPLIDATTRRLGRHPKFGAFDAAFDAFYVYEDFHADGHDGFAAVPFAERGAHATRTFNSAGLPLCSAGLAMPLKATYICRTALVEHEKGRYACPLHFPTPTGTPCPIADKHWNSGGCVTTLPTSIGARIRHQLDRQSLAYKQVYKQRTATERINSQAVELGIERPKIRNGHAIANQNTLIYIVINLRAIQRIYKKTASSPQFQSGSPSVNP
jgi:hypothetical protein